MIDDNENKDRHEIAIKIKIGISNVNKIIYFLDNTNGIYLENNKKVNHNHDNLREMNESNTTLIINGKNEPFKKSFIPTEIGTYSIIFIFNYKLLNSSFMFCECTNIIDINFKKLIPKTLQI